MKFSEAGAHVVLRVDQQENFAEFIVQVFGIGIPEKFLPRLFDKFTQADGSDSRKVDGTGLGLAITKSLVELQGGTIECDSAVGNGTTFTFTLPMVHDMG